jgi:hypothetical protein
MVATAIAVPIHGTDLDMRRAAFIPPHRTTRFTNGNGMIAFLARALASARPP